MKKLSLWLPLAALIIIIIGTLIAPDSPMFWLASSAAPYQNLRLAVSVVLALQLMTSPPRHIAFRVFAGLFAVLLGSWAIQQSYDYHMAFLDSAAFVGSCFTIFATALERNISQEVHSLLKNEPVIQQPNYTTYMS